mmetsp:Transcript_33005/g.92387  ORF Transcript_33005/g.92387 Transcript_33005/m.92387 type:complete len:598 (-) Transcript_33005:8-1801(-)
MVEGDPGEMLSPDFPLRCERAAQVRVLDLVKEAGDIRKRSGARREFSSEAAYKAQLIALEAYAHVNANHSKAMVMAKDALKSYPSCPEALNVQAYLAPTVEAALELYSRVVDMIPGLGNVSEAYRTVQCTKEMWSYYPMRPYLRAAMGKARLLLKLSQYREALRVYKLIERRLDTAGGSSALLDPSYINWRYHVPAAFVHLGKYHEALEFMNRHPDCFTLVSCRASFLLAAAICHWELGLVGGDAGAEIDPVLQVGKQFSMKSDKAATMRLAQQSILIDLLRSGSGGDHRVTATHLRSPSQDREPWQLALFYLYKPLERHTRKLYRLASLCELKELMEKETFEEERLCAILARPEGTVTEFNAAWPTVVDAITAKWPAEHRVRSIRLLASAPGGGFEVDRAGTTGVTPLQAACYLTNHNDAPVIDVLLDLGADPLAKTREGTSALSMATSQGNHIALGTLLARESVRTKINLRSLYQVLLGSPAVLCAYRNIPCTRCAHESGMVHTGSFPTCVELLVRHGLTPSDKLRRLMAKRGSGHPIVASLENALKHTSTCYTCLGACSQKCGRCQTVSFCGRDCQRKGWARHKSTCVKPRAIS